MNPTLIVTAVTGVPQPNRTVSSHWLAVATPQPSVAFSRPSPTLAPLITDQIGAHFTLALRNIIDSIGQHPAATADQLVALAAFRQAGG